MIKYSYLKVTTMTFSHVSMFFFSLFRLILYCFALFTGPSKIEKSVLGITRNFTYWISAARVPGTNIWESDGGLAVKFFNWKKGSPRDNKYNANCIELFQSGRELKWNDIPCEYKRNFICENAFPKVNMYCIRSQEDVSEASGVQ